jgi:hypothetical protein
MKVNVKSGDGRRIWVTYHTRNPIWQVTLIASRAERVREKIAGLQSLRKWGEFEFWFSLFLTGNAHELRAD